ncbi:MAG: transpeptidase family protein, partial [Deltaproteobacteria bacterium]|nr:transpeptidase family protein [Deltaproteobacteria bacterium]
GHQESGYGGGVVLTIDGTIQEIAETELERTVISMSAKSGTVIVMEPATGEILAIANSPNFNPNTFWKFKASSFRNRAVTDCYEPGSTLKMFTMAAALQAKVIELSEKIDCQRGSLRIGTNTIHDSHRGGFALLTPGEILMNSSNIGIAIIGARLGRQKLHSSLSRFGFGRKTGVDLPGETRCKLRPAQSWSEVGLATISFGQGISVTPLQIITGLCSIANGGVWMRPLIVKEIRGPTNEQIQQFNPEPAGRVIEPEVAREITRMLVRVTEPGGTGTAASIPGFKVAGKTGTAQKVDPIAGGYSADKRVASFMGFVPAEQPRIAVLVVIDEPTQSPYGGVVAAPAFARIADACLRYLGVFPEGVVAQSKTPASELPSKSLKSADLAAAEAFVESNADQIDGSASDAADGRLPDLRGLSVRQAVGQLSALGLEVELTGTGRVVHHQPGPGSLLNKVSTVFITMEKCRGVPCPGIQNGTELAVIDQRKIDRRKKQEKPHE